MISIDSDVLRGLATAANATVSEISAGVEKLNAVTTHDDWNCAERDQINEQITAAKKKINTLSINTQTFLDLIRQSANRFDEVDSNTTKAFQSVIPALVLFFPALLIVLRAVDFNDQLCGSAIKVYDV